MIHFLYLTSLPNLYVSSDLVSVAMIKHALIPKFSTVCFHIIIMLRVYILYS